MTDVRIVTDTLGGSPLSRLLQAGGGGDWLAAAPRTAGAWRQLADARRAEGGWEARWEALRPAFAASGAALARLERVQRAGGVVVTTGQQPGLFGGPVYTWSKAMSAIALADAIETATGIATAAVYWAATDDADFAEASSTVVALPGGAEVLRDGAAPAPGTPMSRAPLGDLASQLAALARAAGSASDPGALEAVRAAYSEPGATVGSAFVSLLRALLAPLGMPVLDASHPAVEPASSDTIARALARAPEIERALAVRSAEITAAGYAPQVEDLAGLALVFVREGETKRRLSIAESGAPPAGVLTPNVLLRPLVERSVLPTLAYVAGPGELAYFAQVSAVAGAMGADAPAVVPRWSCTLLEPHVRALLERFRVPAGELADPHALEGATARAAMSPRSAASLAELRATIAGLPDALAPEAEPIGLDRAVQGAVHALQHRVDRLERRLLAGIKRRETGSLRDVATLRAALYPMGIRQERALNLVPLLARHGTELLAEMRDAAAPHAQSLVGAAGH